MQINTNGYISLLPNTSANIPSNLSAIIPYNLDLVAIESTGAIYFRESSDEEILMRASKDVKKKTDFNYFPTSVFIVTYDNINSYQNQAELNTFQIVLASNGSRTYGIFNYKKLDSIGAKAGFVDGPCNTETFSSTHRSNQLTQTSNIGIKGRHIYYISSLGRISCLPHAECFKDVFEEVSCRCKGCTGIRENIICASDHKTYKSVCELERNFCEMFGVNTPLNVSMDHIGDCKCKFVFLIA